MKFLLDHDVPDDLSYLLEQLGHDVTLLRKACNRDDFLHLAPTQPHHGIVIIIRRRTRVEERVALLRLLDRAGETGLRNNVNFA